MSMKKLVLKNTTRISLNERFTYLRNQPETTVQQKVATIRQRNFIEQQASVRNRRLAQQMERRPAVLAALRLKKRSLKQRLGQTNGNDGNNIKDRLMLNRNGFRGRRGGSVRGSGGFGQGISPLRLNRGRGRGTKLTRSVSTSNLSRSQSMQSLSSRGGRGRGKFRGRSQSRGALQRSPSLNRLNQGRRGNRGSVRGSFQGSNNFRRGGGQPRFNTRGGARGGGRGIGRGGFRGRGGRGRGRGMRNNVANLTKEELDSQLDQYMAHTSKSLDRELDSYMKQGDEDAEMWD